VLQHLDSREVRRLCGALKKAYQHNTEMRAKHADDPRKFLDSELELDEELKKITIVASAPDLYGDLLGIMPVLVVLLNHENVDIAGETMSFLRELTDPDTAGLDNDSDSDEDEEEDGNDGTGKRMMMKKKKKKKSGTSGADLVRSLVEHGVLSAVIQRLSCFTNEARGDESEAEAVSSCVLLLTNLLEIQPDLADTMKVNHGAGDDARDGSARRASSSMLSWLLRRINPQYYPNFDDNKLAACELLSMMVQGSDAVKRELGAGTSDGILSLLGAANGYKKGDPTSEEEQEFMQNVFGCLCGALLIPANQQAFMDAEGTQLMLLILKTKRTAGHGALQVLDFALARCPRACLQFIQVQGLKTAFAAFMGRAKLGKLRGENEGTQDEKAEHRAVSIIASLLGQCGGGGGGEENDEVVSAARNRVLAKFVENEYEKCDRLMDLYFKYHESVQSAAESYLRDRIEEESEILAAIDAGEVTVKIISENNSSSDIGNDDKIRRHRAIVEEKLAAEREVGLLEARMDSGLFRLQQVAQIVGHVWSSGDIGIQKHILQLLHLRSVSLEGIREILLELYTTVGDGAKNVADRSAQRRQVRTLLVGLKTEEADIVRVEITFAQEQREEEKQLQREEEQQQRSGMEDSGRRHGRERSRSRERDRHDGGRHRSKSPPSS